MSAPGPLSGEGAGEGAAEGAAKGAAEGEYTYLQKRHPHPKDGLIGFSEVGHKYTVYATPDIEYVSTTSFWKEYTPPFPSYVVGAVQRSIDKRFGAWLDILNKSWIERFRGVEPSEPPPNPCDLPWFNARGASNGLHWPPNYEVFISRKQFDQLALAIRANDSDAIDRLKPLPPPFGRFGTADVSAAWARDGHRLHADIERYLNRCPFEGDEPETKEWGFFKRFLADRPDWEVVRTEMRIFDPELRICGSVDALVRSRSTGKYILVDWKRSKKIKQAPEKDVDAASAEFLRGPFQRMRATDRNKYALQQNMYKLILRRNYDVRVREMFLCVLHPENENYILAPVMDFAKDQATRGMFNDVLNARAQAVRRLRAAEASAAHDEKPDSV